MARQRLEYTPGYFHKITTEKNKKNQLHHHNQKRYYLYKVINKVIKFTNKKQVIAWGLTKCYQMKST